LGVDAAILFADILLPVIPLGLGLEFAKGEGPVIGSPVRTREDVRAMKPFDAESDLGYVMDAIRILRGELNGIPLIGFCGAPFTVASYLIEGGSSREFLKTKTMMYSEPQTWHALMEKLSGVLADYLVAQIRAGAQAVQVFDSWVGVLSPSDYEIFVLPYSQKVLKAAQTMKVPVIHFGTNTTTLLPPFKGILTLLCYLRLCLKSKRACMIFCAAQMEGLVTSSISVMAFCNIRLLRM
jgi:uroporphyrinogen decarboxylase